MIKEYRETPYLNFLHRSRSRRESQYTEIEQISSRYFRKLQKTFLNNCDWTEMETRTFLVNTMFPGFLFLPRS